MIMSKKEIPEGMKQNGKSDWLYIQILNLNFAFYLCSCMYGQFSKLVNINSNSYYYFKIAYYNQKIFCKLPCNYKTKN
jgi:hypothetical protein